VDKKRVWQLLADFAGKNLIDTLRGQEIDSLPNLLAMEVNHHLAFGKLDLYFTTPEVTSAPAFALLIILMLLVWTT